MVNISGINEQLIDKLAVDIMDYADRINRVLNEIQELVNISSMYANSESNSTFRKQFKEIEKNYQTVNQNILSYAKDFIKVKQIYNNKITDSANELMKKNIMKERYK